MVATEDDPEAATMTLVRRVAYIFLPLSFLTIRYFPTVGRAYSRSGEPMFTGLSVHKNSLGLMVLVIALFLLWDLKSNWASLKRPENRIHRWMRVGTLLFAIYMLQVSHSATALICFLVGLGCLWAQPRVLRLGSPARIIAVGILIVLSVGAIDQMFGASDFVFNALGRESSLTGRTEIWDMVTTRSQNVWLGYGFRGFWETPEGRLLSEDHNSGLLLTAHNGYLETYLNGGLVGVVLLVIFLLTALGKVLRKSIRGQPFGFIGLPFWIVSLIYNNSESSFFILNTLWFVTLLTTMDWEIRSATVRNESSEPVKTSRDLVAISGTR
jgi:O-antigen ligase